MLKNAVLEARGVWKGYGEPSGIFHWALKKVDLKLKEGEFVSILGAPAEGKSTLLKILGFLETPDKGEVYFQGRLVGEIGGKELEYMRKQRVWLVNYSLPAQTLPPNLAAVLLDKPAGLLKSTPNNYLLSHIRHFNSRGITVVMATRDPVEASCATSIYKLSKGNIAKINSNANNYPLFPMGSR